MGLGDSVHRVSTFEQLQIADFEFEFADVIAIAVQYLADVVVALVAGPAKVGAVLEDTAGGGRFVIRLAMNSFASKCHGIWVPSSITLTTSPRIGSANGYSRSIDKHAATNR